MTHPIEYSSILSYALNSSGLQSHVQNAATEVTQELDTSSNHSTHIMASQPSSLSIQALEPKIRIKNNFRLFPLKFRSHLITNQCASVPIEMDAALTSEHVD